MGAFQDWLVEVDAADLTIDTSENGLNHEAQSNQWSFSFTQEQVQSLSLQEVTDFLDTLVESCNRRLSQPEYRPAMIFYCWFDLQASSLRFSLVSVSHGSLPFRSTIKVVSSSAPIVHQFLDSSYHDGIPLDAFSLKNASEPVETNEVPLYVWTKELPTPTLRPSGLAEGEFVVPDDFDDPLPDELQRLFEGHGE